MGFRRFRYIIAAGCLAMLTTAVFGQGHAKGAGIVYLRITQVLLR